MIKLLIVDDIESNRKLLRRLLDGFSFSLQEASTARDALRLMETWTPDLVMMDIRMPHMSGDEAITVMKRTPNLARIPVIAISANAMEGEKERLMEIGAEDFISKPFFRDEIYNKIIKILDSSNGSSQADWIPGVANLPQSNPTGGPGVDDITGCYLYVSNGQEYVISAWNMVSSPQTSTLYRRVGFREFQTASSTQFYTCNNNNVGGATSGYNINQAYYNHSYTVSNISDCNETPPAGA